MKVTIFGAGGKMGSRISGRLMSEEGLSLTLVEVNPAAQARLASEGLAAVGSDDAIDQADAVILAVPDAVIGALSLEVVPRLRPRALLVMLDPAAAYADRILRRGDVGYFVSYPAHPPLFLDETEQSAINDYFGSGRARQSVVNALIHGDEDAYRVGEQLARAMWGPILRSHRVTLEQMAILEPALSETTVGTCVQLMRDGLDEAIRLGVPADAARDFILGHIRVIAAVVFNEVPFGLSDGARQAIHEGTAVIVKSDWRASVFDLDAIRRSTQRISAGGDAE